MEVSYHPVANYPFYSIPECTYLQLLSRSKNCIYLYQHNQSRETLVVKQLPYNAKTLRTYQIVKQQQHFEALVRVRGMCLMLMQDRKSKPSRANLKSNQIMQPQPHPIESHNYHETSTEVILRKNNSILDSPKQAQHTIQLSNRNNKVREEKANLLVWMEYYPNNLVTLIRNRRKQRKSFTKQEASDFLLQTISILEVLQRRGFAHRDIKPQNILYEAGKYRLCDFDQAVLERQVHPQQQQLEADKDVLQPTTYAYTSQSFLRYLYARNQGHKSKRFCPYKLDVYALGLTFLYFCSMGKLQIQQRLGLVNNKEVHQQYLRQQRRKFVKENRIYQSFNIILKMMLEGDQYKRDDFKMLMIKVRQGAGGLITNGFKLYKEGFQNYEENSSQEFNKKCLPTGKTSQKDTDDTFEKYAEEDVSDAASSYNKQKKRLLKGKKKRKNTVLGTDKTQGNILLTMIVLTVIIYAFLIVL